tara:strand:- start:42 stop:233 length:192 start_codon:yes stop_codon:yes gene_type:complete
LTIQFSIPNLDQLNRLVKVLSNTLVDQHSNLVGRQAKRPSVSAGLISRVCVIVPLGNGVIAEH